MKLWKKPTLHRLDFLGSNASARRRRLRRVIKGVAIAAGGLGLLAVLIMPPVLSTLKNARLYRQRIGQAQEYLAAQRFAEAKQQLEKADAALGDAQRAYKRLRPWQYVPLLGNNVRAGQALLDIGGIIVQAGRRVADFGDTLFSPLKDKKGTLTFGGMTVAERDQMLQRLGDAEPTLLAVQDDVAQIVHRLDTLPPSIVTHRIRKEFEPARENLTLLEEGLKRAAPIARVLPKLLGHGTAQTYLFLLQNNSELRPTGGFIGTYGIIKVQDGEILSFATENSYNLDDRVKGKLFIPPPKPLQRYNSADAWFFRDANWSPDFPESAAKAVWFYQKEGGREKTDGVLAVTPTVIEDLLRLTGPITVEKTTFTADNFIETLQDQVTFDFGQQGVGLTQRKEIIGTMGKELLAKLFALPQSQWRELWGTLLQSLIEKHLLLNFNDQDLQAFAVAQGWAGAVERPTGDFLMIVDANLASLKSDPKVKRTIEYGLAAAGTDLQATVKITYANEGTFTKKTTRYRTFARVYVPQGSTLVRSDGAEVTDHSARVGDVTVEDELGKTVFGAFKSIEPGTTETLTLVYTLPASMKEMLARNTYTLLVEKQPGTIAHGLSLQWNFPRKAREDAGVDNPSTGAHTQFSHQTDLRRDRTFSFTLEP